MERRKPKQKAAGLRQWSQPWDCNRVSEEWYQGAWTFRLGLDRGSHAIPAGPGIVLQHTQ